MRAAFVTQIFHEMLEMMQSTIDIVDGGFLDQVPNRVKLFAYVGQHNLMSLANTFNYTYSLEGKHISPGSIMRIDLWKHYWNTSTMTTNPLTVDDLDYSYLVTVTADGFPVTLGGPCGGVV